jgi:hypothetical protein
MGDGDGDVLDWRSMLRSALGSPSPSLSTMFAHARP